MWKEVPRRKSVVIHARNVESFCNYLAYSANSRAWFKRIGEGHRGKMEFPRIKIVQPDVSIWLVYAGYRRRHFEQFRRTNRIFLDLPGFGANSTTFENDDEIGRRLAMSRTLRKWLLNQEGARPSNQFTSYQPETYPSGSTEARGLAAEIGNVFRMFVQAKPGDIVISPPIGHYNRMLVGEIVGDFNPDHSVDVSYWDNEAVPARRVRWLSTNITRRSFSSSLARSLQNQHAISQIDEGFTEEVLRLTYPNFSWGDKSKIDVFGTNYTGEDPTQLNSTSILLKYCAAAVIAIERDEIENFRSLGFSKAIEDYYDRSDIDHFRVNFNSPGRFEALFNLRPGSTLMSALLAFAKNDHGERNDPDQLAEDVKQSLRGPGKQEFSEDVNRLVASLRDDSWDELEKLGDAASSDLNIELKSQFADDD